MKNEWMNLKSIQILNNKTEIEIMLERRFSFILQILPSP